MVAKNLDQERVCFKHELASLCPTLQRARLTPDTPNRVHQWGTVSMPRSRRGLRITNTFGLHYLMSATASMGVLGYEVKHFLAFPKLLEV